MFFCMTCFRCSEARLYLKYSPFQKILKVNRFYIAKNHHSKWVEPSGFNTGVEIYDSVSKCKVPLKSRYPNILTWYACGPTVYDTPHIGHGLSYVKSDIMRRILQNIFHINVVQVMGITDIDDKIISKAKEMDISTRTVAQQYEEEFIREMKKLNNLPPLIYARVSDHIPQIRSFIQKLFEKELAYVVDEGSVYFDTSKYGRYGQLLNPPSLHHSSQRKSDLDKKSPRDFALWKSAKIGEPSWISPWGAGRPGWHIECSVIASSAFGEHLDVHSGGIDLLFPHHENEEVQCQAHHGIEKWCNYWIHTGHLFIKGEAEKMSKSLKNTISISEFLQSHLMNSFRLFCLQTPHRISVEYSSDMLKTAENKSRKISSFLQDAQAYLRSQHNTGSLNEPEMLQKLSEVREGILVALADDFDTATALNLLLELISECNKGLKEEPKSPSAVSSSLGTMAAINNYVLKFLDDVGLRYPQMVSSRELQNMERNKLPHVLDLFTKFRSDVRSFSLMKDHKSLQMNLSVGEQKFLRQDRLPLLHSCDMVRDELLRDGIQLKDESAGGHSAWGFIEEKPPERK